MIVGAVTLNDKQSYATFAPFLFSLSITQTRDDNRLTRENNKIDFQQQVYVPKKGDYFSPAIYLGISQQVYTKTKEDFNNNGSAEVLERERDVGVSGKIFLENYYLGADTMGNYKFGIFYTF